MVLLIYVKVNLLFSIVFFIRTRSMVFRKHVSIHHPGTKEKIQMKKTIDQVIVGIVGINGHFGQMLKTFFEQVGCIVIGSDEKNPTKFTNKEVAKLALVVIFSVPIKDTPAIIRSVIPYIDRGKLLMDVTSVKQPAVEAMLESEAQVVGLHPMFRPEVSFQGQTVVVCPARLTEPFWQTWVGEMLSLTRAEIKYSTAAEHDNFMTTVQAMPHLANLASALLIMETNTSVSESMTYSSPFYRIVISLMGRLVSQKPALYASIVMENPQTLTMLEQRIVIEQRLVEIIREKDQAGFEALFVQANKHFGPEVTASVNELFMRILAVLSTLYGKNSVTLEFEKGQSRPGLLERISGVFTRSKVNLTGINSVVLGERLQFTISFEQTRDSVEVCRVLEEIGNWQDQKVKVLG